MKIILFSRPRLPHTASELLRLTDALRRTGLEWSVNEEFAPVLREAGIAVPPERTYGAQVGPQPAGTVMVCYGGDGTLLEGAHRLRGAGIPVLGINAGHLGFLTGAPGDRIETVFRRIADGTLSVERRTLIEAEGDFSVRPESRLALNEFTVQRHGAGLISVETYVDRQMVATYHGDGLIVSTSTGSTAYSLSAGGPVVAPACACLVLTPIAPHNLTMRPVVIPDSSLVSVRIRSRHSEAFVTLDNRSYPAADEAEFRIKRAEEPIFLASLHNISFYDTLRDKMMWGIDIRS